MYLARAWARASAIGDVRERERTDVFAARIADADASTTAASARDDDDEKSRPNQQSSAAAPSPSSRRRDARHGCAAHREGAFIAAFSGPVIAFRELGPRGCAIGEWRADADDAYVALAWQEDAPDDDVDDLRRLRRAASAPSPSYARTAARDVEERVMARACAVTEKGEAHAFRATSSRAPLNGDVTGDVELERVLALDDGERATCVASDELEFVLGTDRGRVVFIDWSRGTETRAADVRRRESDGGATSVDWCASTSTCVVRFDSGAVCAAEIDGDGGVRAMNWIDAFPCPSTCAAFHRRTRALALGTADGEIRMYDDAMTAEASKPRRVLNVRAFGFGVEDTGAVAHMKWSNDGVALAAGWRRRGIGVWSNSGCLLMCSLHHGAAGGAHGNPRRNVTFADDLKGNDGDDDEDEPRVGACLGVPAWGVGGLSLFFVCLVDDQHHTGGVAKLLEYSLVRNISAPQICARSSVTDDTNAQISDGEAHVLLADDRAFVIRANANGQLHIHQAICPAAYVDAQWPMRLACASADGSRIAVAGARGCVAYNARDEKWTMFGSVAEEHEFEALALTWIDVPRGNARSPILAVAARFGKPRLFSTSLKVSHRVQFYSRDRLGGSATLGSLPLPAEPTHLSACGSHFVVGFESGEMAVYKFDMHGDEGAVHPVRESSGQRRMTTTRNGRALVACALTPDIAGDAPSEALVLTNARELLLVDLTDNHAPVTILRDVTDFWVSPRARESSAAGQNRDDGDESSSGFESAEDLSNGASVSLENPVDRGCVFAYGADGMRICYFPRDGARQIFRLGAVCVDVDRSTKNPELEFDRELYPVHVSVRLSRIVGVAQKLSFSDAHGESPYFSIAPKSHTIVPCVLRKLLSAGSHDAALRFARAERRQTPYFTHALEWLLFTALESANRDAMTHAALKQSLALLRELPNYLEIVVSVARKTDNTRWEALFTAAGSPSDLCRHALRADRLRIAACYILVVDKLEGEVAGRAVAIEVMREALAAHDYRLVEDVIKFLLRPVRVTASGEEDVKPGLIGRVLNIIVPPPNSVLALGARADRELTLDVTEQGILKAHLDALAREKDIFNMGAFVSDTSFDGIGYFTHETTAGGSAYIDNFSTALEAAVMSLRRRVAERREKATASAAQRRRNESKDSLLAGDVFDLSTSSTDTARANALLDVARTARCTDWSLLIATTLGRVDVLVDMFRAERVLVKPWRDVCEKCAARSGDQEFKEFLKKTVDEVDAACGRG